MDTNQSISWKGMRMLRFVLVAVSLCGLMDQAAAQSCIFNQVPSIGLAVWPNPRGDEAKAADGALGTWSWLTQSFTMQANNVALDFGSTPVPVSRIRLWKDSDPGDGTGNDEPKDLVIKYTTDTGPLQNRNWVTVSKLAGGFSGGESFNAPVIDPLGSVTGDIHDSLAGDGWGSLVFDEVMATGVCIAFDLQSSSTFCCVHYKVYEFEAWHDECPETFVDLGNALAGSSGEPAFDATGTLTAGAPVTLQLTQALPSPPFQCSAWLVVGFSAISIPFKGGVMVPNPDLLLCFPVDQWGQVTYVFPWPAGIPPGFMFWMQYWIADSVGISGFAASNALLGTTP